MKTDETDYLDDINRTKYALTRFDKNIVNKTTIHYEQSGKK